VAGAGLSNRAWVRRAIAHDARGPVPYNFMFSPPARRKVQEHYGVQDVEAELDFPIRMSACASIKPLYASPAEYGPTIRDEFGVAWSTSDIDRGSPVGPPLAEADLSGYRFPDPTAEWRYADLDAWCRRNAEHFTVLWVGDLWERATFLRGMERLLLDVALNPAFVEKLLAGIAEFVLTTERTMLERFAFDGIALSDDYGTQHGMIISPETWRRLIRPHLAEIFSLAKRRGRYTFLHSCGNIVPILPDLIDVGLDILHPIQPEAMDISMLKRQFGRAITFCGGLRTQDLLPRGTPQQVRQEVRRLKEQMGAGGGYILEPGITVQADVPIENLAAAIDAARER